MKLPWLLSTKSILKKIKIKSKVHSEMLVHVHAAIKVKHLNEVQCKKVMFHQYNTRLHASPFTGQILYRLKWNLLPCPPYSPCITPSGFYLFFNTSSYILLVITFTMLRTSKMSFISFLTCGHQVSGLKNLKNYQNTDRKS